MPKKTVTKCLAEVHEIEDRRTKRRRRLDRTMLVVDMLDFLRDSRNKKHDGSPPKFVHRKRAMAG